MAEGTLSGASVFPDSKRFTSGRSCLGTNTHSECRLAARAANVLAVDSDVVRDTVFGKCREPRADAAADVDNGSRLDRLHDDGNDLAGGFDR